MLLTKFLPSFIYFEVERCNKSKQVCTNHYAMALFREKYSFRRILSIFIHKHLPPKDHLHCCFLNFFIMEAIVCGIQGLCMETISKYVDQAIIFITFSFSLKEYLSQMIFIRSLIRLLLLLHLYKTPGGNASVSQHTLLRHKTCRYEGSHLAADMLFGQVTWVGNFPVSEIMEGWSSDSM